MSKTRVRKLVWPFWRTFTTKVIDGTSFCISILMTSGKRDCCALAIQQDEGEAKLKQLAATDQTFLLDYHSYQSFVSKF